MPEGVQDPPSVEAPIPQPTKSGGVYIPEWIWKALQSILLAAVLGGYGMFYAMHGDIAELKLKVANAEAKSAKLEAELEEQKKAKDGIKESLIKIETELPHIRAGVDEIKDQLRGR